jgi:hypothetical protein
MESHRFVPIVPSRPASPSKRAKRVDACVELSPNMLATENTYHSHGLIAISICNDPWYRINRNGVQATVGRRQEILQGDVVVDFFPPQGFLLLLPEPGLRDRALSSNDGLVIG